MHALPAETTLEYSCFPEKALFVLPPTSEGTSFTEITGAHEPTWWHRGTRAPGPHRSVAQVDPLGGGRMQSSR